ncbi:hypothetical protein BDP55DRAFT_678647 [Colletotrichum godetiae]|uniref:Uncharacterized protein n=1 Tax=Colletotrichum godetiae TaxID=1209918 RepID=A0AAJ0EPL1_9PEZI|nr:uncharacterized protein BDP55DRAFT_678647 [Colletotrichum godetiae]KAK1659836.1 hypothetical protein BDP55DRAFT_678647 [Colletotrichum godetiae]
MVHEIFRDRSRPRARQRFIESIRYFAEVMEVTVLSSRHCKMARWARARPGVGGNWFARGRFA